jgi:hypothetical protein
MCLCQDVGSHRLIEIAKKLGLKRTGSIPMVIDKLREQFKLDKSLKDKANSAI